MINKAFLQYSSDVKLILITTLLSNIGIFMVIPFMAIYLSRLESVSVSEAGLIIGIAFWCQRAGSFIGGIMSDYVHTKGTMLLGLIIRVPGYILVGYVSNFYLLLVACSLIGLGSSIYLPAAKAFLVKTINETEKVSVLSARVVFANVGVAIGPVIGMAVFTFSPPTLFVSVGIIFIILTLLNFKLNGELDKIDYGKVSVRDLRRLVTNKLMLVTAFSMSLFTAFYIQLEVTIPILANTVFNTKGASYVFICNALIVIFFQSLVSAWACSGPLKNTISLAFFLFSVSFLIINYMQSSYFILFVAIIIFSFAEIIIQIRLDYEATNISEHMIATAFGIISLAAAFGGMFGSYVGSLLYHSHLLGFNLWEIMTLSTIAISLVFLLSSKLTAPGVST